MPSYSDMLRHDRSYGALGMLSGDRVLAPMGQQLTKQSVITPDKAFALMAAMENQKNLAKHRAGLLREAQARTRSSSSKNAIDMLLAKENLKAKRIENMVSGWHTGTIPPPKPDETGEMPMAWTEMVANEQKGFSEAGAAAAEAKNIREHAGLLATPEDPDMVSTARTDQIASTQQAMSAAAAAAAGAKTTSELAGLSLVPEGAESPAYKTGVAEMDEAVAGARKAEADAAKAEDDLNNVAVDAGLTSKELEAFGAMIDLTDAMVDKQQEMEGDEDIFGSYAVPVVGRPLRVLQGNIAESGVGDMTPEAWKDTAKWQRGLEFEFTQKYRKELLGTQMPAKEMERWEAGIPSLSMAREPARKHLNGMVNRLLYNLKGMRDRYVTNGANPEKLDEMLTNLVEKAITRDTWAGGDLDTDWMELNLQ